MSLHALWYRRQPLMWLLAPLAGLYAGISVLRHWLYARGWLKVYRAPVPVIVVGNITVGGNGKTPVVVWLVEQLRAQGWHPGVISRGYGGKSEHYPLAVTAATPAAACGDEPRLIVLRCGCPLAVAPLLDVAMELERIALSDPYFVDKKLYPNVDFYSGIILKAVGIPTSMFTVIFALARTIGWISHWLEMQSDPASRISRPRQLYTGAPTRHVVPLDKRG